MAAPRRAESPSSDVFAVRLTPGELAQLAAAAGDRGLAARDLVRAWIAAGCPLSSPIPAEAPPPAVTAPSSAPSTPEAPRVALAGLARFRARRGLA